MALRFIEMELLPIKVLHSRNRDFQPFCSCDLDLYRMTFIYKFDPYTLEIFRCARMNFLLKALVSYHLTDREIQPKLYTTLLNGLGCRQ